MPQFRCTLKVILKQVLTVFLLVLLVSGTKGVLRQDIERLIKDKQINYSLYVLPTSDQSQPLNLSLAFEIRAIREFNEVSEEFSVIGTIFMGWRDDRMIWNPLLYGNLTSFITRHDIFWTPTIILTNAFEEYKKIGDDEYWPLRFLANGDAIYYPGNVLTAVCVPNLIHYPWDKQECALEFQVYGHFPQEIQLVPRTDQVYTEGYSEHGTWELLGSRVFLKEDNITISFSLKLKRKPDFLVVNVLLPIIFMSYLNTLVFLMPTSMGERISYSITVLLAIAVFLTIIGDNMPKSARSIPYLSYYLMAVLIISIVIILMLTVSLRMFYHTPDSDIPAFWAWLGRLSLCRSSQRRTKSSQRYQTELSERDRRKHSLENSVGKTESRIDEIPVHLYANGGFSVDRMNLKNDSIRNVVAWTDVSHSLDWIFFVITFVAITLCTILFIAYAANE